MAIPAATFSSVAGALHSMLETAAAVAPGAVFLRHGEAGTSWTYREVQVAAERLASRLAADGVGRGDRVAIFMQNAPDLVAALFAVSMAGGIYVVMNSSLRAPGVQKILRQAEPRMVLCDAACAPVLEEAGWMGPRMECGEHEGAQGGLWSRLPHVPPPEWVGIDEDPVCLVFTSGSTGVPRGVSLSHHNILFVTAAIQERLQYRHTDVIGGFLPLAFDYGLYQIFLTALAGATLYIGDPSEIGPRLPRLLAEAGVTVLPGVPAIYAALIALHARRPLELPRLRAITNTGERLPPAYITRLREMFPGLSVYVMYGLTECKRVSIMLPEELDRKPHSVGRALRGTEVYAVSPQGDRLPPGATGELVVRGRHLALGYWRAPEETERRYRRRFPGQSVELFTGDSGYVDADGFIHFTARADDLIKYRGGRLSPVEVENETCAIPGVAEAAVFHRGSDDTLHLFVTLTDSALTPAALLQALQQTLEPGKIPGFIHIEPALPKSLNGKIDRKALQLRLEPAA